MPLGPAITLQRIKAHRAAEGEHLAMVAHHKDRPHRLPLAPFSTNIYRQVDHRLERVERNTSLQLAQIADRQLAQVLAQPNDAKRIDYRRLEPAIDGNNRCPRRQEI